MLVFKGGWWWCLQITTTLKNEHTCSCSRVVGGAGARKQSPPLKTSNVLVSEGGDCLWRVPCGGGGKPRVVMVGDGKTTTLENKCMRTLVLEGVVAEGGGTVAVVAVVLLVILVLVGGAADCCPCIIGSCCCCCHMYSAVFTSKPVAATAVSKIKTRKITDAPLRPLSSCSPSVLHHFMWERWGVEGCVVVVSETSC